MSLKLSRDRFEDRRNLLKNLDGVRRKFDALAEVDGLTGLQAQAMALVIKGIADAFDLSKEDPRTLASYDTSGFLQDLEAFGFRRPGRRSHVGWI